LALFRQVGEADGIAYCNLCKGERLLAEGDITQARLSLRKALTDFVQHGDGDGECLTLNSLACTEIADGNLARAEECVARALAIAVDTSDYGPALGAVLVAALLKTRRGDTERGVELYALTCEHPYISASRFRQAVAGDYIVNAALALPAGRTTEATRLGKQRDLIETVRELHSEFV
jgi:hypothetical protein